MNLKTKIGVYWNLIILGRWLITNLIIVLLRDYFIFQIMILLIMSITAQGLMLIGKPRDSWRDNFIDFFIEVCVSLYLYTLLILSDFWGPNPYRDDEGLVLVILVIAVVVINLLNLLYSTLQAL